MYRAGRVPGDSSQAHLLMDLGRPGGGGSPARLSFAPRFPQPLTASCGGWVNADPVLWPEINLANGVGGLAPN